MTALGSLEIFMTKCAAPRMMLNGADRLESAHEWKPYAHQDLFVCV